MIKMTEEKIGEVSNFWSLKNGELLVAGVTLSKMLNKGDRIKFKGENEFEQTVDSIQIDRQDVDSAEAGKDIGLKVNKELKVGDDVYRVTE